MHYNSFKHITLLIITIRLGGTLITGEKKKAKRIKTSEIKYDIEPVELGCRITDFLV